MQGCETGCRYGTSSEYGGSLAHRRCRRCGGVEIDLRDEALGVTALLNPAYGLFDADLAAYEARPGARN